MKQSDTGNFLNQIAIISMNCRFPGAKNIDLFWKNLRDGVESIRFFSDEELQQAGVDPTILNDPNYVKANSVLEDIELFDASFFGFTPREAQIMDPQHRFFLESAWELLESAGYDGEKYKGSIGVYAGASMNTYLLHNLYSNRDLMESVGGMALSVGSNTDSLTTRVSYKLNLRGPSVAVQTACSTSLVAVHIACQNLLAGECDMAMAGGASIICPQNEGYLYQKGGIFSSDGHCRAFDAKADGMVGGRGVGIVLLKRVQDAIEDGDCIHAIIKGSAVNNDGSLKIGFTAPSVEGQSQVIAEALAVAGVHPETLTYVETHGTGTSLGDPIEMTALTKAFRTQTDKKNFCAVGSVKTNFGHADTAAGIAGLIKTVLSLKHKQLPPSLHFEKPNPEIDFDNSPFYVNTELSEWKKGETPRRAGVSSFGIGGTNAHVVVEEASPSEKSGESREVKVLMLSAKTKTALETMTTNLAEHLNKNPSLNLADVAYTLQIGRRDFTHRRMLVCKNVEDAVNTLQNLDPKRVVNTAQEPDDRPVAFMFPGQGAQYVNMGKDLYDNEPKFREIVDQCCELLKAHLGLDLHDMLYPSQKKIDAASEHLKQTSLTQPALFVVEYALAQLWMSWGIHPQAMIGHSIGEYVAACLAKVFSLEDALQLVAARGRLMQEQPAGAMMAVPMPAADVDPLLNEKLSLAAVNSPSLTVVSGPFEAIDEFESLLSGKGFEGRRLHTSHAFHSKMMEPILQPFTDLVAKFKPSAPKIPFISNVTGTWITAKQAADPDYWAQHLRQGVQFADGIEELLKEEKRILLEVGPGQTLSTLTKQNSTKPAGLTVLSSMRHPQDSQPDIAFLLTALGRLWLAGVPIDWPGFYADEKRHRVTLPTYPFQRQRYWVEAKKQNEKGTGGYSSNKKPDIADWFYIPSWKRSVLPVSADLLKEKSHWLIFADECGLGTQLAKRLQEKEKEIFLVTPGKQFEDVGDREYTINPQNREDYVALIKSLQGQDKTPNAILYLWGVSGNGSILKNKVLENPQDLDFYNLVFLAQAFGEQNIIDSIEIVVVTNSMQEVLSEEVASPEKAAILGPCRVIPLEYENINCRSIDIVLPESGSWSAEEIDLLITESVSKSSDLVVAHRAKHRWVQTFERIRLNEEVVVPSRLRQGGTYLITGGLGGIGLALAEYLAQTVQGKLVLVGRKTLPTKDEWQNWLTSHDDTDATTRKIRKIQALEEFGAEVLVASANVADLEQMKEVVEQAKQQFGRIHGVIHSAGVPGGGIIQLKTPEAAADILAAKLQGTLVLDALFKNEKLDFLVLCSSLASVVGGFGQVDYCAANAFLDAYAHHKISKNSPFTVSINWDTWSEAGMAVETEVPPELRDEREEALKKGILNKEGMEAFSRILSSSLPQFLVSTRDLEPRIEETLNGTPSMADEAPEEAATSEFTHNRPELSSDYLAPKTPIEKTVAAIWRDLFGIEQVGIFDDFFELGGHSLLATQLLNKVSQKYDKAKLSLRILFDNATVAGLAKLIENVYGDDATDKEKPIREIVSETSPKERLDIIEQYLKKQIAQPVNAETKQFADNGKLTDADLELITTDLIGKCRQDFGFRIYPHEILKRPSIQMLAQFIADELDRISGVKRMKPTSTFSLSKQKRKSKSRSLKSAQRNESMVFLLSAPRSGSTLLRLMLAGHSRLFCPPELGLLGYASVNELWKDQSQHPIHASHSSPIARVLMELMGLSQEESEVLFEELVQKNTSIQEVYRLFQDQAGTRTIVDKTPSYALSPDTLQRCETLFEKPKYIHLVRHPHAMIESSVRYRLQMYFGEEDIDPYLFADEVWSICNINLLELFKTVDKERYQLLYYEDLVREPERVMVSLCEFLGIPFEKTVLHPYEEGRMIDGPGDLNIFEHDKIDSSLGEIWKKIKLPRQLSDVSRRLAADLNYELPQENKTSKTRTKGIDQRNAQDLLTNLDDLSDEEVNTLLSNMITDEAKKNV